MFYDIFSSLRKAGVNSDLAVFLEDLIFFFVAAPAIFIFLLATTNGEVRLYIILGIAVGFFCFKLTLSKLLVYFLSLTFRFLSAVFLFIGRIYDTVLNAFTTFFIKIFKKTMIFLKKAKNTLKKLLKKQ